MCPIPPTPDGPRSVIEQEDRFGRAVMEDGRIRREMEYYSHVMHPLSGAPVSFFLLRSLDRGIRFLLAG